MFLWLLNVFALGGTPKQFAIIGNKNTGETLIEYSVNQALNAAKDIYSIDKIIFITNPKTEERFINLFGNDVWSKTDTIFEFIQQDFDETTIASGEHVEQCVLYKTCRSTIYSFERR